MIYALCHHRPLLKIYYITLVSLFPSFNFFSAGDDDMWWGKTFFPYHKNCNNFLLKQHLKIYFIIFFVYYEEWFEEHCIHTKKSAEIC